MKNNQKNTLFLSSALQDSLNRISHMYDGYLQTIFSSDSITSQIGQLQEESLLLLFSSIHHKKIRLNKRKLKKPKLSSNVPKMKYCNNSFTT